MLKQGQASSAARAFLAYLNQPPDQAIIAGYGYGVGCWSRVAPVNRLNSNVGGLVAALG
ncbi:hypothetical protein [Motiliproteus sp. SC1-56]|uniref:hypothetical protein n=1 Tax=Motiliproteus sp. SC1-56 TaxID=2799565 RepID=UPI00351C3C79